MSVGRMATTVSLAGIQNGWAPLDASIRVPGAYLSSSAITAGALPTVSPSSGVAFQCSTSRDAHLVVPLTFSPTGIAVATAAIALSPDNSTFSTLVTKSFPALATLAGLVDHIEINIPAGWMVRITTVNCALGTGTYY